MGKTGLGNRGLGAGKPLPYSGHVAIKIKATAIPLDTSANR
jgi:hypothetical protein